MTNYQDWRHNADRILMNGYAIDLVDAGIEERFLTMAFNSGETPAEFVERIALKFDLTAFSEVQFGRSRRSN